MNIVVYLGSSKGNDQRFVDTVRELGTWIGESGNTLIYGGSKSGLMGELAMSALEAGAEVVGVEPSFFVECALQLDNLTQLIVTEDMPERKATMIKLGDAFIAFPGGTGTLEEISEVISLVYLEMLDAPCILYNLDGYYDGLKVLLNQMIEKGFSSKKLLERVVFVKHLDEIRQLLSPDQKHTSP